MLTFWILYDWESRGRQILLEPPGKDFVFRENERLYRCQADLGPPDAGGAVEMEARARSLFEEEETRTPMAEGETPEYRIARGIFMDACRIAPPGTFGEGRPGLGASFGKREDRSAPEMTMSCFGGTFRISVKKVLRQE